MARYPEALVGRTIARLDLADDKKAFKLTLDGGEGVVVRVDGDCCSDSWIEHIQSPDLLLGAPVVAVSEIELPGSTDDNELQVYGFAIDTAKGRCVIDFRNASNGYYGGNLAWPDDGYFYGGVFGQNVSTEQWREVTADI